MNDFYEPSFHDPHISAFRPSFESEGETPGRFASPGMERRLFSSLMAQERYADIDKAKHNPHYLNYLLENFEDDLPF